MKILSVNTGGSNEITFNGVTLKTSMVRTPQSKIQINFKQVQGDEPDSATRMGVGTARAAVPKGGQGVAGGWSGSAPNCTPAIT